MRYVQYLVALFDASPDKGRQAFQGLSLFMETFDFVVQASTTEQQRLNDSSSTMPMWEQAGAAISSQGTDCTAQRVKVRPSLELPRSMVACVDTKLSRAGWREAPVE